METPQTHPRQGRRPQLTLSDIALLAWLAEHGPTRLAEIARASGRGKGGVSYTLSKLQGLGLVERVGDGYRVVPERAVELGRYMQCLAEKLKYRVQ